MKGISTLLVLLAGLAAYGLYSIGDQIPDCVAARVLLTGATVFTGKLECGLDVVGIAMTQKRSEPVVGGGSNLPQAGGSVVVDPPAASSPAPRTWTVVHAGCPCTNGRYIGGDASNPCSWVWTWTGDGREHSFAERPALESDEHIIQRTREWVVADPRKRQLAKNVLLAWGINPGQLDW